MMRYNIGLLRGDQDQMNRMVTLAQGKREAQHRLAHAQALGLARSGRLEAARILSNQAVALALQEGDDEVSATYEAARAVWEAICGNFVEAKASASVAIKRSSARGCNMPVPLPWPFRETSPSRSARGRFGATLS